MSPLGYSAAFARVGLLVVLNLAYYLKAKSAQANELINSLTKTT